ncbi:hypothetical protein KKJ17_15755 [Xenorhabdus bovienii]|uniref:hypothetical protein n=1 Tax=Xenorhabdus bovienii TaxID=40576 RepID=UPI0030233B6B|nr:hypothetical protein [Xenorhabdus bovienii]MDE9503949.1 hypothetical protein [Xenorhabdus bovienii]MDE9519142.1 hypothetical protein [Xenorhabdus bovienii]MDE9527682.1 hypothetical protein [Xenorhabdus bovienii]MDE9536464.1 hypothetical protein [Xenorhabdus bovienii]
MSQIRVGNLITSYNESVPSQDLVTRCKKTLREVGPLAEMEQGRKRLTFSQDFMPKN